MKYIIGLGNPGNNYKTTRHNIAWLIFDALGIFHWKFDKYMNAEFVGEKVEGEIVLYIKPQTFMNRSGEVVAALKKQEDFLSENIILLYDDIDLEFGKLRISYNRGDGGHNGIKSMTKYLGTKKTIRVRIGISKRIENIRLIKPNVLSNFSKDEQAFIKEDLSVKVGNIIHSLVKDGLEETMNNYNKK